LQIAQRCPVPTAECIEDAVVKFNRPVGGQVCGRVKRGRSKRIPHVYPEHAENPRAERETAARNAEQDDAGAGLLADHDRKRTVARSRL
jgi:hypothetical protein